MEAAGFYSTGSQINRESVSELANKDLTHINFISRGICKRKWKLLYSLMTTGTAVFLIVFVCCSHMYVLILVYLTFLLFYLVLCTERRPHTEKLCVAIATFEKAVFEI